MALYAISPDSPQNSSPPNSLILAILRATPFLSRSCGKRLSPTHSFQAASAPEYLCPAWRRHPLLTFLFALFLIPSAPASTLARIRQTRTLRCATIAETPEYSSTDDHGPRTEFDTALCRAVGIAILGPRARTTLRSYPDDVAAMAALRSGKVDLIPTLTLDLTHAAVAPNPASALAFSPVVLFDQLGFLVPASANLTDPAQLSGGKICFLSETDVEPALRAWFARNRLDFVPFPFNEEGEMEAAFVSGNCTALAGDLTRLASTRLSFGPLAPRYAFLGDPSAAQPLVVAEDPLAAATRWGDPAFSAIVTWTLEALLNAEATGLTQSQAAALLRSAGPQRSPSQTASPRRTPPLSSRSAAEGSASPAGSSDPALDLLTGRTREIGSRFGLRNAWALEVLAATGNYGEIFSRTLGSHSALRIPRAQNRLFPDGGLQVPLPLK